MFELDPETPRELREQILLAQMGEHLTDRERARLLGLPEGCRIRERAKIVARDKLTLGRNVWIGEGAVLDAQGGLAIGDFCQIGLNAMIFTHSSHLQALGSQTCVSRKGIEYKPTKIGNNVFVGSGAVIGPGVTIGDKVIISPLSFVTTDLPDRAVFSPANEAKKLQARVEQLEALVAELAKQRPAT